MEAKKSVLLITYYWPPTGGAGVQRWLRFSKYFAENGLQLHVYHPSNPAFNVKDPELRKQVGKEIIEIRQPIFEPHKYLSKGGGSGSGLTSNKKSSLFSNIIVWIRGNLFIPDSRVFWIKPSTKYLHNYLKEHPEITTVISTGPPHSLHVIALKLRKKINFKWIADFRDPWTEIDFYNELKIGKRADAKQKKLEQEVLTLADEVVTVSNTWARGLEKTRKRAVNVISNGFDFPQFDEQAIQLDDKFSIAHFGSMPGSRNPITVWNALKKVLSDVPEFKDHLEIKLFGTVDYSIFESIKNTGLASYLTHIPMVPHAESLNLQRKTQLLLLIANNSENTKGILTGKIFEYLGAKRPIIALGLKDSDLEQVAKETNCGGFFDYSEEVKLGEFIKDAFIKYQNSALYSDFRNIEKYSSKNLANTYCKLC